MTPQHHSNASDRYVAMQCLNAAESIYGGISDILIHAGLQKEQVGRLNVPSL